MEDSLVEMGWESYGSRESRAAGRDSAASYRKPLGAIVLLSSGLREEKRQIQIENEIICALGSVWEGQPFSVSL